MTRLVCGVGIYEDGKYAATVDAKPTKAYQLWKMMFVRCYSHKSRLKCPTYVDCTVDEKFHKFQDFMLWAECQKGFCENYCLDKDIIVKGNKCYGPDYCVFVPQRLNNLLIRSDSARGAYPIGVYWHKTKMRFIVQISLEGKNNHVGNFYTQEQAFQAYKIAKEFYIKQMAEQYKDSIDIRAYNALMNYQVEITD